MRKYADVKRFLVQKYGKRIGELRFKLYMAARNKKVPEKKPGVTITRQRRINLFVF